jgi:tRNA A-37 threonylcarbamoyl transferase component Bud32
VSDLSRVEEIFLCALEKHNPEECAGFLEERCRGEAELRRQVERLLQAHPRARQFLEPPGPEQSQTPDHGSTSERAGTIISGRYKLLEKIGEGGMGDVWVADQLEPIKRRVALKLVKPGMDSRSVLSRFEAERQALAVMDHPNVAKVFDAGTTADGRPYFVMELVKGTPITEFCDIRKLTPKERLQLFIPVCQAIQHAHMKGMIHRDIKPSNVLVALHDEVPVPKVIDFGVAKALGQRLTEKTVYTGFGALIGTPAYMAPEQATFNQLDVDTRADIYALGVLLYELLTGSPPIESDRIRKAALDEILRVVREEEPPRPSQRLSTSQAKATIAAHRQSDPLKLSELMRAEIDWIVMKALEKDRTRRYDTANGLAADIQRYLAGEAVLAHPPSAAYRASKFVRKHRFGMATAAAFAGFLIAAAAVSAFLALRARRAEAVAQRAAEEARQFAKSASHSQGLAAGMNVRLVEALEESKLAALSSQIDSDLAEIKLDRRIGLLKLARTLKARNPSEPAGNQPDELRHKRRELREFATMAVLATGQAFATLLPLFSHDEQAPRQSEFSSNLPRLLTAGSDRTARLWDLTNGKPIAILRRKDEQVLWAGLSPDGATAFTDCSDGVVRLWETIGGTFRAETAARPERVQNINLVEFDSYDESQYSPSNRTQLSDNRVLTLEKAWKLNAEKPASGPNAQSTSRVELWDAKTGRLVARLELPRGDGVYQFFGNGRWIEGHDYFDDAQPRAINRKTVHSLHIFSAENGRPVAELRPDAAYEFLYLESERPGAPNSVSPSGRTVATVCSKWISTEPTKNHLSMSSYNRFHCHVHLWDTTSWKPTSVRGPFKTRNESYIAVGLLTDDLLVAPLWPTGWPPRCSVFRSSSHSPVAELTEPIVRTRMDRELIMLRSGQLFETRSWRRVQPTHGRKYHPDLALFAPDGRLTVLDPDDDGNTGDCIDTATDKVFQFPCHLGAFVKQYLNYVPQVGWLQSGFGGDSVWVQRLPVPDQLDIPPALVELWAQVVVRGELDEGGSFVKWNESTWEKKCQELAGKPVPYADFPFPGHITADKLHWLRTEFDGAPEADKPGLAKQLLDRAEAAGDQVEASRWRKRLKR